MVAMEYGLIEVSQDLIPLNGTQVAVNRVKEPVPERALMSDALLRSGVFPVNLMRQEITLAFANGTAVYALGNHDDARQTVELTLVSWVAT